MKTENKGKSVLLEDGKIMKCPNFVQNGNCDGSSRGDIAECVRVGYDGCREVIRMIEYKDYAKFESLSEMSEAIEMGLDIEFILSGKRYNISRRDNKPFICECPEGEAMFYTNAQTMLYKHRINDIALKELWNDIEILSM